MEFREGMLGVVIVALALTAALGASYFAGIEPTENQVTKFNHVADVSGLFDYDKSPQYIEYDPSSNYVGYYSTDTGEYFPVDDVGYEKNQNVNNYRINLEPVTLSTETIELGDYTEGLIDPFGEAIRQISFQNADRKYITTVDENERPKNVTLSSYVDALDLDDSVTKIEIRSLGTYSEDDETTVYHADWINFSTSSMWFKIGNVYNLDLASQGWFTKNGYTPPYEKTNSVGETIYKAYLPGLSCSLDLKTGIATLYYDNDCKNEFATSYIDAVYMTYTGSPGVIGAFIDFDERAEITKINVPAEYLNPNFGVTMKG